MILDTTALAPEPKINATTLKSNTPTSSQTSAPIITNANAIIVVNFINVPPIQESVYNFLNIIHFYRV